MRITELEQRCPSATAAAATAPPKAKVTAAESESDSDSESKDENETSTVEGLKGKAKEDEEEEKQPPLAAAAAAVVAAAAAATETLERTELPQAPFAPAPVPPLSTRASSGRPRQTRAQLDEELAEQKRSLMLALANTLNVVSDTRKEVVMVACTSMNVDPSTFLNDPEQKPEEDKSKETEVKPPDNEEKPIQSDPPLFVKPGPRKPRSLEEVKAWLQNSGHKSVPKLPPSGGDTNSEESNKIPQKLEQSTASCLNISEGIAQNEALDDKKRASEQTTNNTSGKNSELSSEQEKLSKSNTQPKADVADVANKKSLKIGRTKTHSHSTEASAAPMQESIGDEFSKTSGGKKPKNDSESGMTVFFQDATETLVTNTSTKSSHEDKKQRKARSKTRQMLKEEKKKDRMTRWTSVDTAEIQARINRSGKERSTEKNNQNVPKAQLLHKYAAGGNLRELLLNVNRDAEIIKKCGAKWARSPYEEKMLPSGPARKRNSSSTSRLINPYWQ